MHIIGGCGAGACQPCSRFCHAVQVKWRRIVLDEAHSIKDRSCSTAKAVFALDSKYKLCLTGTPLQNRVGAQLLLHAAGHQSHRSHYEVVAANVELAICLHLL